MQNTKMSSPLKTFSSVKKISALIDDNKRRDEMHARQANIGDRSVCKKEPRKFITTDIFSRGTFSFPVTLEPTVAHFLIT